MLISHSDAYKLIAITLCKLVSTDLSAFALLVYIYICMYVYINTHTHTHTHHPNIAVPRSMHHSVQYTF